MTLEELVEWLKVNRGITEAERQAQIRSFAYGNLAIDNPEITREMVDRAAERLKSDREC